MNEIETRRHIAQVAEAKVLAALMEEFKDEAIANAALLAMKVNALLGPVEQIPPTRMAMILTFEHLAKVAGIPIETAEERQALVNRAKGWMEIFDEAVQDAQRSLQLAGEA